MSGPSPVLFPGWMSVFTGRPSSWGEVPVLGYVGERLWLVVRTRSVVNQGQLTLTDYCKCCGTSVRPLQSVELFEYPCPRLRTIGKAILFRHQTIFKNLTCDL